MVNSLGGTLAGQLVVLPQERGDTEMKDKQMMDDEKTMEESKKDYEKPELKVHGDLRDITKQGGGNQTDFPGNAH